MQVCEMRAFRSLYSQRELLKLTKTRFISNPELLYYTYTGNEHLSSCVSSSNRRSFHSSNRRFVSESNNDSNRTWGFSGSKSSSSDEVGPSSGDESPNVVTIYDPVSDSLVTRTVDDDEISTKVVEPTSEAGTATVRRTWSSSFRAKESLPPRKTEKPEVEKSEKPEVEKSGDRPESSSSSSSNEFVFKKKKGKKKISWVCSNCGESSSQWWGYCRHCQASGTLKEFSEPENDEDSKRRSWMQHKAEGLQPQRLTDVTKGINQLTWRIPLSGIFGAEVSRVLGGGLVPGSLVLVGGDPGVGKSTLVLQIAAMIAEGKDFDQPAPVVYVSGEESAEQIGNRADRMRIGTEELFLYSSTDIEDILEKIQVLSPRALVIDSIQTVYLKEVTGSAGGLQQVKECTSALLRFAKKTNVPVFLIGHVTKTGDIAGPRVLEHIVDVVLYMEGEKYSSHRFLRSVKNRFGSTDELGVFEMAESGLQAVSNPSEIFLSEQYFDSDILVGLAVAVIIDGSRTFLIEIQALCVADDKDFLSKQFNGVHKDRFQMIIAVLMKQAGLKLQNNAIFVNVVSGVKLKDTSGDLAIAAAICSSFLEFPIPNNVAFIGEVGLGGELRAVSNMEKRVIAVSKLGYKRCIVPKTTVKSLAALELGDMMIIGCKNLKEVINTVFQAE